MKSNLSVVAALALAAFLQETPSYAGSGFTPLPRQKKRTGAMKQQRASRKQKNRLRSGA